MSSSTRFGAARPKRAGEEFARTHHHDSDGPWSKKPRFDVRNPSALAPDAPEEDAILEADVIGGGGTGTKRNAVNLDGYDSDSDNEGFDARAEERRKQNKGDTNLFEQLNNYGKDTKDGAHTKTDVEEDADMFADLDEEPVDEDGGDFTKEGKRNKAVRFLEEDEIEGQVLSSKSGGHISGNFVLDPKGKLSLHAMDDQESSDDEEDAALAAQEEDIDEEVGAGGLKRNAPKVDAFNMKAEQEEGRFDAAGNYVRKAADPDAIHDSWLEGVSKKQIKKAAEAHEKREAERRQKRLEDDMMLTPDLLRTLILQLEKGESVLEALARLGKGQSKTKKIPKWKLKKLKATEDCMDGDAAKPTDDPTQVKIREAVDAITGAADQLLTRGQTEIYEQEREALIRQYRRETGEDWVEPPATEVVNDGPDGTRRTKMWEYRWTDGRDGNSKQGPYDGATMLAWQDAGYFGEGVEFRRAGEEGQWSRLADFV
jgi:CD2 antigen cytoplasmic tail-binding protein 2